MQKAVIYCRVSSERQKNEGHGIDSQRLRCEQYATAKGYIVSKCFKDEAVSGASSDRPGFNDLLKYLDRQTTDQFIVIIDDISRLARDMQVHLQLRQSLRERKVRVESPNHNFEESPEGTFIENIIASKAQLDREQNRRQVIQKQKARFDAGYWPLCYPPGMKNARHPVHGKILTPDEPIAEIFKRAIEQFKDGILNTLEQTREFINTEYKKVGIDKRISINGVHRVLTNPLYCGWIEYKPWGVPLKKAQHEGFISKETFDEVQKKLLLKSKSPLRKDYNLDFPLRGFIICSECKSPMTASWHKGRNKRYAHYFCKQPTCAMYVKNIAKDRLENEFQAFVDTLTPNKDVVNVVRAIITDAWNNRVALEAQSEKMALKEIQELETRKNNLVKRLVNATNEDIIKTYESEIEKIIKKENEIRLGVSQKIHTDENFGTATAIVLSILEKPALMWQSPNYKDKRLLLEMYFEEKITYDLKAGLGTASLAPLPKLLCMKEAFENHLVEMAGVEPASEETRLINV